MDDLNLKPVRRVDARGNQRWRLNGRLHRTDGPADIAADGTQEWWVHDQLHRTDGPAVIAADGTQEWWVDGQRHRTDGPAVVWSDGTQQWWMNDKNITPAVEKWLKDRAVSWPWPDEETRAEFLLTWA